MTTKDFTTLNEKIVEFNNAVNTLKSMFNSGTSNGDLMNRQKEKCKQLSELLVTKFKTGKFAPQENMKVQKLSKDFERIFKVYLEFVEKIKQKMIEQQAEIEQQFQEAHQRRQSVIDQSRQRDVAKQAQQDDEEKEEDEDEPDQNDIQEIESVNPEVEHYGMMIQEKNNEIQQISTEVEEVYKIMEDVAKLTFEQGEQLNVAEDNINTSNSNVKVAAMELESAQTEHKSYKKKMLGSILILIIIIGIILLFVL